MVSNATYSGENDNSVLRESQDNSSSLNQQNYYRNSTSQNQKIFNFKQNNENNTKNHSSLNNIDESLEGSRINSSSTKQEKKEPETYNEKSHTELSASVEESVYQ